MSKAPQRKQTSLRMTQAIEHQIHDLKEIGYASSINDIVCEAISQAHRRQVLVMPTKRTITVSPNRDYFVVEFRYDPFLVKAMRSFPGRRFSGRQNYIPATLENGQELLALAERFRFTVDPAVIDLIRVKQRNQ